MDEDLKRRYQRWHDAEESDRDEDADAACGALFAAALRTPAVTPGFTSGTVSAVVAALAADATRARRVRRATVVGGAAATIAAVYAGGGWVLAASSALLVGVIDLLVGLTVWIATGLQGGTDTWSILAGLGRAAGAFVSDPTVTAVMLAMQGIAMAALVALQRLLRSDRESLK